MQLTRAADYGVRAMVYLAGLPLHSRVSISELAKVTEAPEAFLTKVLQRLVASGLIDSHRGPSGGFELNSPAAGIFMLDVVEAIEGPLQLNLCTGKCNGALACSRQEWCAAHVVWEHAQAKLREILGAASIETLAHDSRQRQAALNSSL